MLSGGYGHLRGLFCLCLLWLLLSGSIRHVRSPSVLFNLLEMPQPELCCTARRYFGFWHHPLIGPDFPPLHPDCRSLNEQVRCLDLAGVHVIYVT